MRQQRCPWKAIRRMAAWTAALLVMVPMTPAQENRSATDQIFGTQSPEAPSVNRPSDAGLEPRLKALEKNMATIEARLGRPVQTPTAAYNMERRLQDIERRMALVEREWKRLDERIRRLEQKK